MAGASSVEAVLGRFSLEAPPAAAAGASVMILLREGQHDVETLLIERSVRPGDPASGHVSFPGGHVDPTDRTLRDTALRELEEEVGLGAHDLVGTPRFVSIEEAPRFSMKVGVFAAELGSPARRSPAPSPHEVASVFWLPRASMQSIVRVTQETPIGPREVEAVEFGGHVLWGFTLRVLAQFFAADARGSSRRGRVEPLGELSHHPTPS